LPPPFRHDCFPRPSASRTGASRWSEAANQQQSMTWRERRRRSVLGRWWSRWGWRASERVQSVQRQRSIFGAVRAAHGWRAPTCADFRAVDACCCDRQSTPRRADRAAGTAVVLRPADGRQRSGTDAAARPADAVGWRHNFARFRRSGDDVTSATLFVGARGWTSDGVRRYRSCHG
jgi:hypothetical protein